jgi:hypothetical protein
MMTGMPYPTAAAVDQLVADINYADTTGGSFTVNLASGATFDLTKATNNADGGTALPVIGGAKAVNLTILGNGATIERVSPTSKSSNNFHLFDVAAGASLTLNNVMLQEKGINYISVAAIAIYNHGTLMVSNCTASNFYGAVISNASGVLTVASSNLSGNDGSGIQSTGGTVTVSDSTLSNDLDGSVISSNNSTLTITNCTLSGGNTYNTGGNLANSGGTVTIKDSIISGGTARYGGGIANFQGTVTLDNVSMFGNSATWHMDYPWTFDGHGGAIYNSGGTVIIGNSSITSNGAVVDGAGIYNDANGTIRVENSCSISGNGPNGEAGLYASQDVHNLGVLYLDSTSAIGIVDGNPAIPFDPNIPQLQVHDVIVTEGNTGTVAAQFTVTMSAPSNQTVTVNYATADGTATVADSDYLSAGGALTFAPGETTKTVNVTVNGDTKIESDETFNLTLANATGGAVIATPTVTGTILNDDLATSSNITINDVSKLEDNNGNTSFVFTVTLDRPQTSNVTVHYATADGTATAGSDYKAASGTLSFAPGVTSKTITVSVKGDRVAEPNETFFVNLTAPTNATIVDGQGVGTIIDDEPHASVSNTTKAKGGNGQTSALNFAVTLSTAYDQLVVVSHRTADSADKPGEDYTPTTGKLIFAPGETTKNITIKVQGDKEKEINESYYLDLFGLSGHALFTKSRGIGTILHDDSTVKQQH